MVKAVLIWTQGFGFHVAFLSLLWRLLFMEQWNCSLCCRLSCAQKEQEVLGVL